MNDTTEHNPAQTQATQREITPEQIKDNASVQALHQHTPYIMCGVGRDLLSIAKRWGRCCYGESVYIYQPTTGSLVRDDVLKALQGGKNAKVKR